MSILVIAPHPDDETLGCGGTLLRRSAEGAEVHWLIVTGMSRAAGYSPERIALRQKEIAAVERSYGFASTTQLELPPAGLDTIARKDVVAAIAAVVDRASPTEMYIPWRGDAHTDHQVVFEAASACAKRFRHPAIRRVLAYETPSETDHGLDPTAPFVPNVFVDVSDHIERKLEIAALYEGEIGEHPFPRSERGMRALATVRGAACGVDSAEAFVLLRESI